MFNWHQVMKSQANKLFQNYVKTKSSCEDFSLQEIHNKKPTQILKLHQFKCLCVAPSLPVGKYTGSWLRLTTSSQNPEYIQISDKTTTQNFSTLGGLCASTTRIRYKSERPTPVSAPQQALNISFKHTGVPLRFKPCAIPDPNEPETQIQHSWNILKKLNRITHSTPKPC